MIGRCSYVIGVLLLIHLHSTHQFTFHWYLPDINKDLCREKPGRFRSGATYPDIACDKLTPKQKQELCDDAMIRAVANERYMTASSDGTVNPNCRDIRIALFLSQTSRLPVPRLADESDPYTCRTIPIEGMELAKRMWWCMNRVVAVENSNETEEVEGYFMAGGKTRRTRDKVFIFKPSPTNDHEVIPWAKLDDVNRIEDAYMRAIGRWQLFKRFSRTNEVGE